MFRGMGSSARKYGGNTEKNTRSRRTSMASTGSNQSSATSKQSTNKKNNGTGLSEELFTESINVIVRCRGRGQRENEEKSPNVVSFSDNETQKIKLVIPEGIESHVPSIENSRIYTLDKVYGPATDQLTFFQNAAESICDEFLKGFNCTIFAYGQTGAGKTYTMCGKVKDNALTPESGIIPRCMKKLFDNESSIDNKDIILKCSFVEIYNEVLKDLLSDGNNDNKLKIYEQNKHIKIHSLEEFYIHDFNEAMKMLKLGMDRRKTASTKMNEISSRSHTIFTIHLMKRVPNGSEYQFAKMNLVDLAGSENINRSGSVNQRAKEAGSINQSLLTLGRVINSLVDGSSFIPYRESKLTRLLQDSLGGRTKTILIANIAPTLIDLQSTISTLEYASKAKNIKNAAQIGSLVPEDYILNDLLEANRRLKLDLLATRRRENCIVLDENSYRELHLLQKSLKDEVEELRGLKMSLLNQLDSQMQTIDKHKMEKASLNENIQCLEQKLVAFENKFRERLQNEELMKAKYKELYYTFKENLSIAHQSQLDTKSLLSVQVLKPLLAIEQKLDSMPLDDSSSSMFQEIHNELMKITEVINESSKLEDTINKNLTQAHSATTTLASSLKKNEGDLLGPIDQLSEYIHSQILSNKNFHGFLDGVFRKEDPDLIAAVKEDAQNKLIIFQREMNQKLDALMNETNESNYRLYLKHYHSKISKTAQPWNSHTEQFESDSNKLGSSIHSTITSQQNDLSKITEGIKVEVDKSLSSLSALTSTTSQLKETRAALKSSVSETQKLHHDKNKNVNNIKDDIKNNIRGMKDKVDEVIADKKHDVNWEEKRTETWRDVKEIIQPFVNDENVSTTTTIPTTSGTSNSTPLKAKTSLNYTNFKSPSKTPSKSPSKSPAKSPAKSPMKQPIVDIRRSPTKSPFKINSFKNSAIAGSRNRSRSRSMSPVKSQSSSNLAFGLKRESSLECLRDSKRQHY